MKDYIEERAMEIANYIIEHQVTVRQAAKYFRVSQHKDDKQYWEYLTEGMRVKVDKYDVLERGMGTEQIEHVMKAVEERERGWR